MGWTDETVQDGVWGDGAVWTIGEAGIWIGMPGLFIGMGYSHREGAYSDESPATGLWGDS